MIRETGITLWTDGGATKAFEGSRALLDAARPQYVQLHTDPTSLAGPAGAALTKAVRAAYPEMRVVWAVQGDSYGPDPSAVWAKCAKAALANGVTELMLNCESGWKQAGRGDLSARNAIARKAVDACRKAAPGIVLWHTSYDGPVSVVTADGKSRWGGHSSFPWKGFLAAGGCEEFQPQVYVAPAKGLARAGLLADRADRSARSINAAIRAGLIAPSVRRTLYLQAHGVRLADTCSVAMDAARTSLWASPTRIDDDGKRALCVLSELARRGQSIREAQEALGLTADGIVGPKTLAALGVKL